MRRIDTGHLVQSSEFFKLLTPVDAPPHQPDGHSGRTLFGLIAQDLAYPTGVLHLHHRCDGAARQRAE